MARFNPHEKSAALYPVVSEFADRCLLQDGSILQPNLRLCTAENLAELERTFVQNPDEGTDSYYLKLEQQMSSGTPESRQLMAELHWVLFTFPSDMGPATKAQRVREIWSWSGTPLPEGVAALSPEVHLFRVQTSSGPDMNRVSILSILLMTASSAPALAQDSQQTFEEAAAASFASSIEEYDIPGLVVGVTHRGKHSFYQTGLASRDGQQPVTPDTLFELGSISKIFNVTLAGLAEARGQVALEASVGEYLPSLQGSPAGELTLLDLATHHSGGLPLQVPDEAHDVDQLVDWLRAWEPMEPGARSYSNISIGLLGHITANAMDMSYAHALEAELFPALGLTNTWIDVPTEVLGSYAFGYDRKTNAPIRVTPGVLDDEAYGVKSSARDMLALLDIELAKGNVPAKIREAVARTQEGRFQTRLFTQAMIWEAYPWPVDLERMVDGNSYDFILKAQAMREVNVKLDQDVILNKAGSTNGFGGYIAMVPGQDLGIVVLANRNYPNEARVRATHDLITRILTE